MGRRGIDDTPALTSADAYRLLFEGAENMVCTLDLGGCITSVNPAGERLTEIRRDARVQVDFGRKRECPRCEGFKLKRHFFSAKRRVEVDECPNCGGYWLDAGELAQIRLEKSQAAEAGKATGVSQ